MERDEIKAKLDELGVEYNPRLSTAKLADLLEEAQNGQTGGEEPAVETQDTVPEESAEGQVTVYDQHKRPHRTYSLERHGEDYQKLAEQYVSARPGWTVR